MLEEAADTLRLGALCPRVFRSRCTLVQATGDERLSPEGLSLLLYRLAKGDVGLGEVAWPVFAAEMEPGCGDPCGVGVNWEDILPRVRRAVLEAGLEPPWVREWFRRHYVRPRGRGDLLLAAPPGAEEAYTPLAKKLGAALLTTGWPWLLHHMGFFEEAREIREELRALTEGSVVIASDPVAERELGGGVRQLLSVAEAGVAGLVLADDPLSAEAGWSRRLVEAGAVPPAHSLGEARFLGHEIPWGEGSRLVALLRARWLAGLGDTYLTSGWHASQVLRRAFEELGVKARVVALQDLAAAADT